MIYYFKESIFFFKKIVVAGELAHVDYRASQVRFVKLSM